MPKHDLKRILFFIERNLHLPFLEPILDYFLRNHPETFTAFSAPHYRPSEQGRPGRGLDRNTIEKLSCKSNYYENPRDFIPQVSMIADINATYYLKDCGRIVNVGHSLNCKGRHYTLRPVILRENLADLVCVPGPFHSDILKKSLVVPVETTGYIKSDILFGSSGISRRQYCINHDIDPARKIILFAPTFDPELSAISVVREKIFNLAGPEAHLVIKLHSMTDQFWINMYENGFQKKYCTFCRDIDITPSLRAADILISDVSSAFLEFMLLDKPIILVDNPQKTYFSNYDPNDIEYQARECCTTVDNFNDLKTAVIRELKNPGRLSARRKKYARKLCLGRDGKSVERTVQAVLKHMHRPYPESFSVLVFWQHQPSKREIDEFLENLQNSSRCFDLELIMAGPGSQDIQRDGIPCRWIECSCPDAAVMRQAVNMAENEYIAVVEPGTALPESWPKFMLSHLHWNKKCGLVQALPPDHDFRAIMNNHFPEHKHEPLFDIAFLFSIFLIGSGLNADQVDSPCFMFARSTHKTVCPDIQADSLKKYYKEFGHALKKSGFSMIKSLDVFVYPLASNNQSLTDEKSASHTVSVSIIIPVFNNLSYTRACLESIFVNTSTHGNEIIIVNNGSTDGTAEYLADLENRSIIKCINNQENLGFARACNQGARAARGDYLLFLNNDTKVTRGWLDELLQCVDKDLQRAAVGAKLLYPDNSVQHAGVVFTDEKNVCHLYKGFHKDHPAVNKPRAFQAVSAACMLVRKEPFFRAGMFDEQFRNGFEDIDLCLKLNKSGFTCYYCPQSQVYHYESKTPERFIHNRKNELLLGKRWAQEIVSDEYSYYEKDLLSPEMTKSATGEISFLLHDSNVNFFWKKAKKLMNDGKLNKALEMYNKALQFNPYDPRNFQIMEELSQLCFQMNLLPQAENCLANLIRSDPSPARYLVLSKVQKKLGKLKEAAVNMHKSMELT